MSSLRISSSDRGLRRHGHRPPRGDEGDHVGEERIAESLRRGLDERQGHVAPDAGADNQREEEADDVGPAGVIREGELCKDLLYQRYGCGHLLPFR